MTEEEVWRTSSEPSTILKFLGEQTNSRKLRLFVIACCYRIWHCLDESRGRQLVETAEQCAEGLLTIEQSIETGHHLQTEHSADTVGRLCQERALNYEAVETALHTATLVNGNLHTDLAVRIGQLVAGVLRAEACGFEERPTDEFAHEYSLTLSIQESEDIIQSAYIRDIFGNPFRPVTMNPSWLSSNVIDLARTIYDERCFERLPILADALMDAGCNNEDILNHCRSEGPHV